MAPIQKRITIEAEGTRVSIKLKTAENSDFKFFVTRKTLSDLINFLQDGSLIQELNNYYLSMKKEE